MTYTELKESNAKLINAVPIAFAFSKSQFEEAKEKLGCHDESKLCYVAGGGIMKKEEAHLLIEAYKAMDEATEAFMSTDEGMLSALIYELSNHEFCITRDADDTLAALGLSRDDERVKRLLPIAAREYLANCDY